MPSDRERVRARLEAGMQAHRAGDRAQAIDAYRDALALAPDDPDAANLLGVALLEVGRRDEALPHLERAARRNRNEPRVLANLAQAYLALERHDQAESTFRKAARLAPADAQYQIGIAAALGAQRKFAEAQMLLRRLSARFPDSALIQLNLGHTLRDQQRFDEAAECYRKSIALEPTLADAHNDLGRVFHMTRRLEDAEEAYRRCIALAPGYLPPLFNLASVSMDRGRFTEAERICRELVARAPHMSEAHTMLAAALGHQGKLVPACASYRRAVELAPNDAKAVENLAIALLEIGRVDEGLRMIYNDAAHATGAGSSSAVVGSAYAMVCKANALLTHGQLQDGWRDFRLRPAALRLREKYASLDPVQSLPADLAGKHLGVLREQGLGDEIFLLRYAAALTARGARITYRGSGKIAAMLARVPHLAAVVDESAPMPPVDAHVLLGDLPHLLGTQPQSDVEPKALPASVALGNFSRAIRLYWPPVAESLALVPLAEKLAQSRARLATLGPAPYIGITWRAGTQPEDQGHDWVLHKSVGVEALADALRGVSGTLIALQRHPAPGEIDALAKRVGRPLHDLTALNEDLESMLALLALLDDYVGVSNTNMHLRAAAGRTARVLVPAPAEWRWMQFGAGSPWFPGFGVYRQRLDGDWAGAFAALARDLRAAHGSV